MDPTYLDDLHTSGPPCRGCLMPLPIGRRIWCSARCKAFVRAHPRDFLRVFRNCHSCGIEIDHLYSTAQFCDHDCWRRANRVAQVDPPVSCLFCQADVPVGSRRAYCSQPCWNKAMGHQKAEPEPLASCALPDCGATFQPWKTGQRCCSERHSKVLYNRESRADGRQKPPPWTDARRDRYHRRRALIQGASTGEAVLFTEIAERDGWVCSLCHDPVSAEVEWPDSKSPSLDHVIPLSKGGAHDPSNVALAHLGCNSAKCDRSAPLQLAG